MRAAIGKVNITPPDVVGRLLAGYTPVPYCKGKYEDIFARIVILEDIILGNVQKRMILISLELCYIPLLLVDYIKEQIQDAYKIHPNQILVHAIHTHKSLDTAGLFTKHGGYPVVIGGIMWGAYNGDDKEKVWMTREIVRGIGKLIPQLRPAKIGWTKELISTNILINRRHPSMNTKSKLGVLVLRDAKTNAIFGLIVNFAMHPTSLAWFVNKLSADYPGSLCEKIEQLSHGTVETAFFTGPCGDLNPITTCGTNFKDLEIHRKGVYNQTGDLKEKQMIGYYLGLKAWLLSQKIPDDEFYDKLDFRGYTKMFWIPMKDYTRYFTKDWFTNTIVHLVKRYILFPVALALADVNEPNFPGFAIKRRGRSVNLYTYNQYFKIIASNSYRTTELGIAGVPGELFEEIAESIYKKTPSKSENTFIFENCNDYTGYLFPLSEYPKGGYEPFASYCALCGTWVKRNFFKMLHEIEIDLLGGFLLMSIEEFGKISHYLSDYPSKWAKIKPNDIGLIDADEGKYITWQQFENQINLYAFEFMDMGLQKGDILITMLPLIPELIFMEYAAFKLGIVACPFDVRLKEKEVVKCVELLKKAHRILYIHPDDTDSEDKWGRSKFYAFQQIAHAVRVKHSFVQDFIQLGPQEDADWGTVGILNFLYKAKQKWIEYQKDPNVFQQKLQLLEQRKLAVDPAKDGAMIIYTTGSTGFPKPAVLSHAGIVCQNMCLAKGFEITEKDRILVNLPPSHVAGQTVALMSMIYAGGIAVFLHGFRSDKSLQAVQDYKLTIFGQIPALFAMEWNLPNYNQYDLSSVRLVIYGAQGVTRPFLEKFQKMAPFMGTGLGMTEACGFVTFIMTNQIELLQNNIGFSYPITPMTIRQPMKEDGTAGDELTQGEIGEICFSGPQIFLHYFDNEEATKKAISKDGILYTGDMGFIDKTGLHLSGRRKFIMKPKGYQVYPAEVEDHIAAKLKDKIEMVAVLGMPHEIFSEAIICYVEFKPGKTVTMEDIMKTTEDLAAYKRPSHVVILGPEEMPLNRTEKTDYMILRKIADKEIEKLRSAGKWDKGKIKT